MDEAIVARRLLVRRGDNVVLRRLDFTVPAGGITGLLGPSGCGKTTLMRSVVGVQIVESPTCPAVSARGCRWRPRCWRSPGCSSSTSPRSGSTRSCARSCGGTFEDLAAGGTTLLVSSHVMDEADHCQRLLLMREGELIATETPDGLRRRTGEQGLEEAFLALIEERQAA